MKKITFILFALIAGTTFAQVSESTAKATANAAAHIVSPIEIESKQDLNFGKVANNAAGTVVVKTDSDASDSSLSQIGTITPTAAMFHITAAENYAYSVTLPTSVALSNGTVTITVDSFIDDAGETPTGSGEAQTVGVGATLNVASGQATGNYTGTFDVTVTYE